MTNKAINTRSFKTVALDSSILANLSKNYFDNNSSGVSNRYFVRILYEKGYIPFLTTQHLAELIKHKNDQLVAERLAFLATLPIIAWISDTNQRLGNIKDIHVLECNIFLKNKNSSVFDIRDIVGENFLQISLANHVFIGNVDWPRQRRLLWHEESEQRKMVAASLYNPKNINEIPLKKLFSSVINFDKGLGDAIKEIVEGMNAAAARGDKRIESKENFGEYYMERSGGKKTLAEANGITFEEYIRRCGLDPASLNPEDTVRDLAIRLEFIGRLDHIQDRLITDFQTAKGSIFPETIPSWLSEKSLKKFRQHRPEHQGSEINDQHLAALSIYCDLTYVDKRTFEDMKRAFSNVEDFRKLANQVRKVTSLDRILQQL